jgi:hypothetical protein
VRLARGVRCHRVEQLRQRRPRLRLLGQAALDHAAQPALDAAQVRVGVHHLVGER